MRIYCYKVLTITKSVSIVKVTDNVSRGGVNVVHENLKKIRTAKGVTQSHLAKKLTISNMAYSRMENGDSKIDVERLRIISKALNVDIAVFFESELTESVIKEIEEKRVAV